MGMFLSMFLKIEKEKREEYKEDKENNVKKQKNHSRHHRTINFHKTIRTKLDRVR